MQTLEVDKRYQALMIYSLYNTGMSKNTYEAKGRSIGK